MTDERLIVVAEHRVGRSHLVEASEGARLEDVASVEHDVALTDPFPGLFGKIASRQIAVMQMGVGQDDNPHRVAHGAPTVPSPAVALKLTMGGASR